MSKFKVGDKVWCNGDVKIIKRIDKWGNGEYGYYFNIHDGMLEYNTADDLELYKTPHEKLLELGWKLTHEDENMIIYNKRFSKSLSFHKKHANCFTDERNIDLQLAEVLVYYLKELEND